MLCVRWYLTFKLSSRDLVQMMAERGITLTHTTILRWVQLYVPEFEKRWSRYARPVGDSWRVDYLPQGQRPVGLGLLRLDSCCRRSGKGRDLRSHRGLRASS